MIRQTTIHLFWFVLFAVLLTACNRHKIGEQKGEPFAGYAFPKPIGYVNDFVHLFSQAEVDTLNRIIVVNEAKTTNQVAVVTIKDSIINKGNLPDYVTALFNRWGVGTKEKNNGVMICIVPDQHLLRICNGYGITKKMTDDETAKIIDSVITPEYKKSDYYAGTKKGLLAVINKIK